MSEEMVNIGCRLPNGIDLEVGYSTTVNGGPQNRLIPLYRKHDNYRRVHIRGTRSHTAEMRRLGMQVPSVLNAEPAFTPVPKAFWDAWVQKHQRSYLLSSGQLFVAPADTASARAATMDAVSTSPAILQPMDPTKPVTVNDSKVEVADFHKDNVERAAAAGGI